MTTVNRFESQPQANGWIHRAREKYIQVTNRLGFTLYRRPTHQDSLSTHPHHIDVSQGLFTDLTMVGVLYKLDALFLQRALVFQHTDSFWIPFAIHIALYDAWAVRPIFDSQFRTSGKSLYSHWVQLALWMLIALMGTTLATEGHGFTTIEVLDCTNNTAAHSLIRLICYVEVYLMGKSKLSRNAAVPFLIQYAFGVLPLIAAPIMASMNVSLNIVVLMFPISFLMQKTVWSLIGYFDFNGIASRYRAAKFNFPFYLHRLREWTELHLGACVLGLIAFKIGVHVRAPEGLQVGVMVAGYFSIAVLDFMSYATHPFDFRSHALLVGGIVESVWIDGFVFMGLGLLGYAVGLRYALLSPAFDYCTGTENTQLLWLLSISALVTVLALLFQQLMHVIALRVIKPLFWVIKFLLALTILISPFVMMSNIEVKENIAVAFFILLNVALAVLAILIVHAWSGGFKHRIKKSARITFTAYALAAVIAMHWLARTRARLQQQRAALPNQDEMINRRQQQTLRSSKLKAASTKRKEELDPLLLMTELKEVPQQTIEQERRRRDTSEPGGNDDDVEEDDDATEGATSPEEQHRNVHVFIKTLNRFFYERPKLLAETDLFAEYKLSWSDLFLDIIYVSAVFRVGDYLLAALGLGEEPDEKQHQSGGVYLFGSLFLAVFSCWWSKIAYSAKCAVSDVFHKFVDVIEGFLVFVMASSITSPQEMSDDNVLSFSFTIALLLFHLIMLFRWAELGVLNESHHQVVKRSIYRALLAIAAVLLSIICIALDAPWVLISFFFGSTWLFPLLHQLVVIVVFKEGRSEIAYGAQVELLGYVQHRIGDLALLWLGEGVMQVVRAQNISSATAYSYGVFAVAFLNLSLCRSLLFTLGLFSHDQLGKHLAAMVVMRQTRRDEEDDREQDRKRSKQQQSQKDALGMVGMHFLRSISGPCIVAMGIGLKKIVALTNELSIDDGKGGYTCDVFMKKHVYELYSGSAVFVHFIICCIFHIHRSGYFNWQQFAWKTFVSGGIVVSLLFLVLTWVDCVPPLEFLIYSDVLWILSFVFHSWTDDFLKIKAHEGYSSSLLRSKSFVQSSFMRTQANLLTRSVASKVDVQNQKDYLKVIGKFLTNGEGPETPEQGDLPEHHQKNLTEEEATSEADHHQIEEDVSSKEEDLQVV